MNSVGKLTNQRKYILDILSTSKMPISIEEIVKIIEKKYDKKIAFSTVFRNLEMLVKNKYLTKDFNENGSAVYVVNEEHDHHEHVLKCLKCNKEIVIKECPFITINKFIEKETGFKIENDEKIKLRGYCKDCKQDSE